MRMTSWNLPKREQESCDDSSIDGWIETADCLTLRIVYGTKLGIDSNIWQPEQLKKILDTTAAATALNKHVFYCFRWFRVDAEYRIVLLADMPTREKKYSSEIYGYFRTPFDQAWLLQDQDDAYFDPPLEKKTYFFLCSDHDKMILQISLFFFFLPFLSSSQTFRQKFPGKETKKERWRKSFKY